MAAAAPSPAPHPADDPLATPEHDPTDIASIETNLKLEHRQLRQYSVAVDDEQKDIDGMSDAGSKASGGLTRRSSIRDLFGTIRTVRKLRLRRNGSTPNGGSTAKSSVTESPRKELEQAALALESVDLREVLEDIPEELLETSGIFLGSIQRTLDNFLESLTNDTIDLGDILDGISQPGSLE